MTFYRFTAMTSRRSAKLTRVLYLDHTAELGGGEIALFNLVRNVDRDQIIPIVLLFAEGPLVERLRPYVETHVLVLAASALKIKKDTLGWKSLLQIDAGWSAILQILRVACFARRMRIDIIHANSLKADIIGGVAARLSGIPAVWHVRDRIEPDYLPAPAVKVFRFLSRVLPDFVIANSLATLSTIQLNGKRGSAAIPSGIDLSPRKQVLHDGGDQKSGEGFSHGVRIGLVGRISPWKGQHVFIEAASKLHDQFPHARFEIIGAPLFAEHEYETHLHKLCEQLKLKDKVEFTGFVEDVRARIAMLNVVVHASTTGEPFGQAIIEGMVEQKPVVATNGGGVPEIVVDGVTGLLVPMGDASAMAKAIEFLLLHPEAANAMGLRGRERALSHFTIGNTARKVEEVYRKVLAHSERFDSEER